MGAGIHTAQGIHELSPRLPIVRVCMREVGASIPQVPLTQMHTVLCSSEPSMRRARENGEREEEREKGVRTGAQQCLPT